MKVGDIYDEIEFTSKHLFGRWRIISFDGKNIEAEAFDRRGSVRNGEIFNWELGYVQENVNLVLNKEYNVMKLLSKIDEV